VRSHTCGRVDGKSKLLRVRIFILRRLGYPCMVRPSYVLGGRAMEIVYSDADLKRYIQNAVEVRPCLLG